MNHVFFGIIWVLAQILRLLYRIEVKGLENLPRNGVLLCPNHASDLDPVLIGICLPINYRLHFMAKEELFQNRLFGRILRALGAFPVNREGADIQAVKTAMKVIHEGENLLIFPEGTTIHDGVGYHDGLPAHAHSGIAMIGVRSGATLVPVFADGKKRMLRKTTIIFGEPYVPQITGRRGTSEELQKVAPAYQPIEYYRYKTGKLRPDGQPGFNTPTGRIELWSNFYNRAGLDPLPYFEEPEPGPGSTPELMDEYPLVMTSGARFWGMFHSEHRQIERMRHYRPWPLMDIHPDTAAKYSIKDGDWVWMEGPMGRAKRKAKLTVQMDRRIVSCDHGWWFPEGDPDKFYDVFDLNINNTLPWIPGKSGFGSNYKSSICKIYKVEGE